MLLVPKMLLLLPFFMAQAMNSGILLAEYNQVWKNVFLYFLFVVFKFLMGPPEGRPGDFFCLLLVWSLRAVSLISLFSISSFVFLAHVCTNLCLLWQKFVSCAVGIQWVGYVMTVFGVLTSAQAVGLNYAAKFLSRRAMFTAAALADLSVNVAMLMWDPTGTSVGLLFIMPCVSGFAEGIFQAQFNCECHVGVHGLLFNPPPYPPPPPQSLPSNYPVQFFFSGLARTDFV